MQTEQVSIGKFTFSKTPEVVKLDDDMNQNLRTFIADFLNLIFGLNQATKQFWSQKISK